MRRNAVYDFVIPFGERCCTTQCLKHYNLRPRGRKLPFDWIGKGTIETRVGCILDDFHDFLVPERLCRVHYEKTEMCDALHFYDEKTELVFGHDFPKDLPFDQGFVVAMESFLPKINRIRKILNSGKKILFVHMDRRRISNRVLRREIEKLRKRFNNANIDLLVIENGIKTWWPIRKKRVAAGITKYTVRLNLVADHFAETSPEQFYYLDKIFSKIHVSGFTMDDEIYS